MATVKVAIFSVNLASIQLANSLAGKNIDCLLVLPAIKRNEVIAVDRRIILIFVGMRREKGSVVTPLSIIKILAKFRPNVVHMWCAGGKFSVAMLPIIELYSKITGCPRVSTIMEPLPRAGLNLSPIGHAELKLEINSASCIVTTLPALKTLISEAYGISHNKIHVITDVEWDSFLYNLHKSNIVTEEKWVLFFGEVTDHKGLEYLIKAEPLISKDYPSMRIVIAGRGLQKYLKYIIHKEKFILIDRYIPYKEAAILFQKSSIVVMPYTNSTLSGILGPAYTFGKPVVATAIGGFSKIIENGKTGLLVPPRNPGALALAITYLLANHEKSENMGRAGYKKLKKEYSWEVNSEKMIKIYNECR